MTEKSLALLIFCLSDDGCLPWNLLLVRAIEVIDILAQGEYQRFT